MKNRKINQNYNKKWIIKSNNKNFIHRSKMIKIKANSFMNKQLKSKTIKNKTNSNKYMRRQYDNSDEIINIFFLLAFSLFP